MQGLATATQPSPGRGPDGDIYVWLLQYDLCWEAAYGCTLGAFGVCQRRHQQRQIIVALRCIQTRLVIANEPSQHLVRRVPADIHILRFTQFTHKLVQGKTHNAQLYSRFIFDHFANGNGFVDETAQGANIGNRLFQLLQLVSFFKLSELTVSKAMAFVTTRWMRCAAQSIESICSCRNACKRPHEMECALYAPFACLRHCFLGGSTVADLRKAAAYLLLYSSCIDM
jgi:hypothetical protein